MLACDFLTVETAFLQRVYVLFFISLATRRIESIACTPNPDGRRVTQQARNLVMQLGDQQRFRCVIHDRDTKLSHPFDEVFRSEGGYEPLREQSDICLAVHWVLGRPGVFLHTVGDVALPPKVLDAAGRFASRPTDETMDELAASRNLVPLFS